MQVTVADSVEAITVSTDTSQITGIYRPFKIQDHSLYLNNLISHLEMREKREISIVIGDFNFDFQKLTKKNIN